MTREPRGIVGIIAAATLAVVLALPMQAQALTTAEGAVIGDQGFYWFTPAESWIFPHRIGNTDNRVMIQWDDAPATFSGNPAPWYNTAGRVAPDPLSGGFTLTMESVQTGPGGGFILELMEGMNVGGRRAITVPPEDGFGPEGNPQGGLPADTDMIFVIELIGTY